MPGATIGFADRHIGPRAADLDRMLKVVGAASIDALMDEAIPAGIRLTEPLDLPDAESEAAFLARMRELAARNEPWRSFIGLGYYGCVTPPVILRNLLENPGWYTPYTPYQAEVAQGRLEALLNFQTAVADLTGMEIANASLLDEATAAAEAMTLLFRVQARQRPDARRFLVSPDCFPQTIAVVRDGPSRSAYTSTSPTSEPPREPASARRTCSACWCSRPTPRVACTTSRR